MNYYPTAIYTIDNVSKLELKEEQLIVAGGDCSDGYHTFQELYDTRLALTVALFRVYDGYITPFNSRVKCWKSRRHDDGSMFDGHFIVGMTITEFEGPPKYITFHYKLEHWDKFNLIELSKAPPYDGYKTEDVIKQLFRLMG